MHALVGELGDNGPELWDVPMSGASPRRFIPLMGSPAPMRAASPRRIAVDLAGGIAQPIYLPRHSVKTGVSHIIHLGALDLTPDLSLENLGAYQLETSNHPGSSSSGYTRWHAGLTLAGGPEHERWSVTANCSNCSDRDIPAAYLPPTLYLQQPRRWSVRFRYQC
jgi:hypothetical protein